jgi:CheY-like chemotaxis protein
MDNANMEKFIFDERLIINLLMISNDEEEIKNLISVFKEIKINNPVFCSDNTEKAFEKLDEIYEKYTTQSQCMILLDRSLPNGMAYDFLERLKLRNQYKLAQIEVFLIDNNDGEEISDLTQWSLSGLITKPISLERFAKGIASKKLAWRLMENQ